MPSTTMKSLAGLALLASNALAVGPSDIRTDPMTKGPELEIVGAPRVCVFWA